MSPAAAAGQLAAGAAAASASPSAGPAGSPSADRRPLRARIGERRAHHLERRRLPGPQVERGGALVEQHRLAVGGDAAGRGGLAQQSRLRVDQVEDEELRVEDLRGQRRLVGPEPDRGRVHQDLRLRQLGLDDRLVPGHRPQLHVRGAAPEVLDQPLGPVEVAVEHDDPLEALADQAVDDGPRAAAGAQHDRGPGHLLAADEDVERDLEAGHVGVVADELAALLGQRVDGAGRVRLVGELVDHRDDPLLVGDRDVGAQEVVGAQLHDRVAEIDRGSIPQLVLRIDAEVVEGRLLHGSRERMGDRVADEDDALRHARTPSSSLAKPGYETAADPGRRTIVSPVASRPAIANVIASR